MQTSLNRKYLQCSKLSRTPHLQGGSYSLQQLLHALGNRITLIVEQLQSNV